MVREPGWVEVGWRQRQGAALLPPVAAAATGQTWCCGQPYRQHANPQVRPTDSAPTPQTGEHGVVRRLAELMTLQGLTPDTATYNILLRAALAQEDGLPAVLVRTWGLCLRGHPFHIIRERSRIPVTVTATCLAVLHASPHTHHPPIHPLPRCCCLPQEGLQEMQRLGLQPNLHTRLVLIAAHGTAGDAQGARAAAAEALAEGRLPPSEARTVVHSLLWALGVAGG